MKWWERIRQRLRYHRDETDEKRLQTHFRLFREIEKAKEDWINAQKKLNFVTEADQIDYAIYALEAAEKRYEMLLRQAKQQRLNAYEIFLRWGGRAG